MEVAKAAATTAELTVSLLFLAHLGKWKLAGGFVAIAFAYITGYLVISGLARAMEVLCDEAKKWNAMILVLLCASLPIGFLWINIERILLWCGHDEFITTMAGVYITFSLPDLLAQAFLTPIKIYLFTQHTTLPVACCDAAALLLHILTNFWLVSYLLLGVKGVALAAVVSRSFNVFFMVVIHFFFNGVNGSSAIHMNQGEHQTFLRMNPNTNNILILQDPELGMYNSE